MTDITDGTRRGGYRPDKHSLLARLRKPVCQSFPRDPEIDPLHAEAADEIEKLHADLAHADAMSARVEALLWANCTHDAEPAQTIEAQRAETQSGSVHESVTRREALDDSNVRRLSVEDIAHENGEEIQVSLRDAADEIEKLTERCEAYKGQVQNGAIRIEIAEQRCADLTAIIRGICSQCVTEGPGRIRAIRTLVNRGLDIAEAALAKGAPSP